MKISSHYRWHFRPIRNVNWWYYNCIVYINGVKVLTNSAAYCLDSIVSSNEETLILWKVIRNLDQIFSGYESFLQSFYFSHSYNLTCEIQFWQVSPYCVSVIVPWYSSPWYVTLHSPPGQNNMCAIQFLKKREYLKVVFNLIVFLI